MATITVVTRDDPKLPEDTAKHIYTYNALTYPRVGEYIQIVGKSCYTVERVIHKLANGSDSIIVEVKEN